MTDDRWRADLMARLEAEGVTLAVAESLTGGLLALAITEIPGSGTVFSGGVVAYHADAKRQVLGVPDGPVVSGRCAEAMAVGAARVFGCDVAVATTGVAGPATQEGRPVGTVYTGWSWCGRSGYEPHCFGGDPDDVRAAAVDAALRVLAGRLASRNGRSGRNEQVRTAGSPG